MASSTSLAATWLSLQLRADSKRLPYGKKRYFVSDPKPADSAFFDLSHQLASDFPELRARLGELVRRNAGKSLLDPATDPVKLKTLLKVPAKRAEKIIRSLGGFTLAGVDAAAALNEESIIPVVMCSELKLSDKIEVASNPYHLCVALQSSECHSKLKRCYASPTHWRGDVDFHRVIQIGWQFTRSLPSTESVNRPARSGYYPPAWSPRRESICKRTGRAMFQQSLQYELRCRESHASCASRTGPCPQR